MIRARDMWYQHNFHTNSEKFPQIEFSRLSGQPGDEIVHIPGTLALAVGANKFFT